MKGLEELQEDMPICNNTIRAAYISATISIGCLIAVILVLPIIYYRLETTQTKLQERIAAFKVIDKSLY